MNPFKAIATRLIARMPSRDDDRGSLIMAMMAILVGTMLGGLMLPMVINQDRSTRFDITRVHSLHAAQTGIDVVLGQIRSSTTTDSDGNVWGDVTGCRAGARAIRSPAARTARAAGRIRYGSPIGRRARPPAARR